MTSLIYGCNMGIFVFPKGNSKQELIEHIKSSLDLWEHHELSTHVLDMAKDSLNKLIEQSNEANVENDAKNDAYFILKKTYKICSNCKHKILRETKDIDWKAGIEASYCDILDTDDYHLQMNKKFKDVDRDGSCELFEREEH